MESTRPLARLSADVRAVLTPYGAKATWPAGFTIYERGAAADGLFVVLAGRVVLRSRVKAGRGFVPAVAVTGETFGAEGLTPRAAYATDARAEEASETLHVRGPQLRTFLREQPLYGQAVLAQVMAERTELLEKLREVATLSVEDRLVAAMLRLAAQRPRAGSNGKRADGRHADGDAALVLGPNEYRLLCELVGATRESVSLVFNRFAASGLVDRDGTTYTVTDVGALADRLGSTWAEAEAPLAIDREPGAARATAAVGDR